MYKKLFLLLFAIAALNSPIASAQDTDPNMGIIPAPVSVKKSIGSFILSQQTTFLADSPDNKAVLFLKDYLRNKAMLNVKPQNNVNNNTTNSLVLTSAGTDSLPAEGYRLTITPQKITIAGKGAGLFYGIQTLIQLMPAEAAATIQLPCLQVTDYPRFGYRGMMLDVCRHFFSVEFVKKYIDLMAAYKLNNFHWHLTDDQGWRIEIKKYPRLTQIGSQRAQTLIGNYHDRTPQQFDNTPYGGYYTQDQIREVVKYAADRYINVVPEIEMPGHSEAALAAYPELSCDPSKTYKVSETWGVFNDVYCPSDQTFNFLEDVLTEVMDLFPSKYIHIGGDEVPKIVWQQSAFCHKLIKKLKLKDEHGLQSYFIQRIEQFVNSKGRRIIGWDEILEGGLAPNATVMSWTGEDGGIAAAHQKHNVIMTPQTTGNYFDHYQSSSPQEPISFGRYAVLEETYNYNPVSKALAPDEQKYVIGTQGNLWTEYVPSVAKMQYQMYPRLFALSEVAWSKVENKDYTNFSEIRLAKHFARLDAMNYDYRVPTPQTVLDTIAFGPKFTYTLFSVVPGAKILYTLNGHDPLDTDLPYTSPVTITIPANEKREFKARVITPSGRRSIATRVLMYNRSLIPASTYTANTHGLKYKLIKTHFTVPEQLDMATGKDTTMDKLDADQFKAANPNFGITFDGYINVPTDGAYNFGLSTYTDARLFIDGEQLTESEYMLPLAKGFHKIQIKYIYNVPVRTPGTFRARQTPLKVYVTEPGGVVKKELDPANLYY